MTRNDRIWAAVGAGAGLVALACLVLILRLVLAPSAPAPKEPAPLAPAPLAPRLADAPRPAPPPTTRPAPLAAPRWELSEHRDEMTDERILLLSAPSDPVRRTAAALLGIRRAGDGSMSVALSGHGGVGWFEGSRQDAMIRLGGDPAETVRLVGLGDSLAVFDCDARALAERLRGCGEVRIRCDTMLWEGVTFRWPVGAEYGPLLDRLLRGQGPAPAR